MDITIVRTEASHTFCMQLATRQKQLVDCAPFRLHSQQVIIRRMLESKTVTAAAAEQGLDLGLLAEPELQETYRCHMRLRTWPQTAPPV